MKQNNVNLGVLELAIGRQGSEFQTRDISDDPDVQAAHRSYLNDHNYNAMIGKALSEAQGRFGIGEVDKNRGGRGSVWIKRQ